MVSAAFITELVSASIPASAVLLYACLGEIISERAGVLNLGVEGMMLVGALTGFAATVITGSPYIGFVAGAVSGALSASIHAVVTIKLKVNQVVSGLSLTFLATGLTTYLGREWVDRSITGFQEIFLPFIGRYLFEMPIIGPALVENTVTTYVAFLMAPVIWYFINHSNLGLEMSAAGRDPKTSDSLGVPVFAHRFTAVLIGGAFAGAGGAHLSLGVLQLWSIDMVAGRGWIALALVIFAQWGPVKAMLGSLAFGLLDILQLRSQSINFAEIAGGGEFAQQILGFLSGTSVMGAYPYIFTFLIVVWVSSKTNAESLGAPKLEVYERSD